MEKITRTVGQDGSIRYHNQKGQLHREDGPAVEYSNGFKYWYKNGHLHREDGPAIERTNGDKEWSLNGKLLTKEQWEQETLKIRFARIQYL